MTYVTKVRMIPIVLYLEMDMKVDSSTEFDNQSAALGFRLVFDHFSFCQEMETEVPNS
ncbi:hypothetical protein JWG45_14630 [Leptospira sp. 201903070]|uniref:Uncharacterized protein n=1 Tax=Leptospira ainlahdjerensis TaxID=2810033 RepID=A0ABS2UEL1_9LEPT|nr:hypothetical protein [Leptospira ainlahdjerensis]MBM9578383.1 hypothetical protein [Leptospira ainlahdjerensis]